MDCTVTNVHTEKKKNLDTDLPPFTEINPKWIIDINASCKTIQLLGKSIKKKI